MKTTVCMSALHKLTYICEPLLVTMCTKSVYMCHLWCVACANYLFSLGNFATSEKFAFCSVSDWPSCSPRFHRLSTKFLSISGRRCHSWRLVLHCLYLTGLWLFCNSGGVFTLTHVAGVRLKTSKLWISASPSSHSFETASVTFSDLCRIDFWLHDDRFCLWVDIYCNTNYVKQLKIANRELRNLVFVFQNKNHSSHRLMNYFVDIDHLC